MTLDKEKMLFYWYAIKAKITLFIKQPGYIFFYIPYYMKSLFLKKADVTIVSYPKSGVTWLTQLLSEAIKSNCNIKDDKFNTLRELSNYQKKFPTLDWTHAGSTWEGESVIRNEDEILELSPEQYAKGGKVIFLYRDPRDVLVSSYYHTKYRTGITNFSKEQFLSSRIVGLKKIINFMNAWHNYVQQNKVKSFMISYEELKQDTVGTLKQICSFVGLEMKNDALEYAVESCQFNKMQKKEKEGVYNNPWLAPRDKENVKSFKVRSGKSGEYKEFFSLEQLNLINSIIINELNISFGYKV